MSIQDNNYIEKVYAGILGKIIGIRSGAVIEMWTAEQISEKYGEVNGYLTDYKHFAADDDSNGPLFFIKALQDYTCSQNITAQEIGLTWLNYAPYGHSFYWWGGYGISSEHTAYLNLRNGIQAPRSGSTEQNGLVIAEQIGGQIFIDTWGLVAPGNISLAASLAQKAASVSHDGNGIYGGMFIAACISAAFKEKNTKDIILSALTIIPQDCTYASCVKDVMNFYNNHPQHWKECFAFIKEHYWSDKYTGNCHIIPNAAIIILALLYGENDFSKTLNICNMCGFDTDCNTGNIGTIMGVLLGLNHIDYDTWRKPINDLVICSSVIGSLNIQDIPNVAYDIAKLGYVLAQQNPQEHLHNYRNDTLMYHFEFPGSTHAFCVKSESGNAIIQNTQEHAHNGSRSLKLIATQSKDENIYQDNVYFVYNKTHYTSKDFNDSRYDPSFSPVFYPGQTVEAFVCVPDFIKHDVIVCLYAKDFNHNVMYESNNEIIEKGSWTKLTYSVPFIEAGCIEEVGIKFIVKSSNTDENFIAYMDDICFYGNPHYSIDFSKEYLDKWYFAHYEVSQFSHLKGIWTLEDGELSGSTCDFGEAYTGFHDWKDYQFTATIKPKVGTHHGILCRVQGAIRSYLLEIQNFDTICLLKNDNGYTSLVSIPFNWTLGESYTFTIHAKGNTIQVYYKEKLLLEYTDTHNPYMNGQIGCSVRYGSHCHYKDFVIT